MTDNKQSPDLNNEMAASNEDSNVADFTLQEMEPVLHNGSRQHPAKKRSGFFVSLILGGIFILSKVKYLAYVLKLAKFKTMISMMLMAVVYAQIWGWKFAVGFVLLLFVHEMGHVLHLRKAGIRAGAPVFIPFVGAAIAMKQAPPDAEREAFVGIGGPLWGGAAAGACFAVGYYSGDLFWYALAFTGFMLNAFNMIPISPLDGGRIMAAVSRAFWLVGLIAIVLLLFVKFNPILLLVLLLGGIELYGRWKRGKMGKDALYYKVPVLKRFAYGVAYLVLFASLGFGMYRANVLLEPINSDPANRPPFADILGGGN